MKLEVKKLIYDLDQAIYLISEFTNGKQLADYQSDALIRSAVERIAEKNKRHPQWRSYSWTALDEIKTFMLTYQTPVNGRNLR
jgi:hypothetical protein